jgi:hypothetical protein
MSNAIKSLAECGLTLASFNLVQKSFFPRCRGPMALTLDAMAFEVNNAQLWSTEDNIETAGTIANRRLNDFPIYCARPHRHE